MQALRLPLKKSSERECVRLWGWTVWPMEVLTSPQGTQEEIVPFVGQC